MNQSLLAGLSRDAAPWLDPDQPTLLNMAYGLPVLMGPPTMQTEDLGPVNARYMGYDTARGPMFDLLFATGELLHRPETNDALTLVDLLMTDHEPEIAALIRGGLVADAVAEATPDASIPAERELWDDVIQVAQLMPQAPATM